MVDLITIQEIRELLSDESATFARQGYHGKLMHISADKDIDVSLLHGSTSSSGEWQSVNYPSSVTAASKDTICKKCLSALYQERK
jgi:hypothetical protein